jgi:hypothetical protein
MSDPDWARHCGDLWRHHVLMRTGRDICDIVGPSPRRPREWVAMMRRLGVRDMAGVISAVHGPPIDASAARPGDVVQAGWAIGICLGPVAEFYGRRQLAMGDVDRAWRV